MRQRPAQTIAHIRATEAKTERPLEFEAAGVAMLEAAESDGDAPKTFAMTAYTGGAMHVGFGAPVVIDLADVRPRGEQLPILRDHDRSRIVGHSDAIEISAQTIKVRGVISGANAHAEEIVASARNGFPWKASVGAKPERLEFVERGASVTVNGKRFEGPLYVARQTVLTEVSFVAIPADERTRTKVAAAAAENKGPDMGFEAWVKAKGLVLADLGEDKLAELRAEYDAEIKAGTVKPPKADEPRDRRDRPEPAGGDPLSFEAALAERRRIEAAEMRRVGDIRRIAGEKPEIAAKAIEENWSIEKTELEVLRASRPTNVPAGIVRSAGQPTNAILEAAVCQAAGLADIESHFKEETLEAAYNAYRGQIGLQELLVVAAQAHGYQDSRYRSDPDGVLRAAFDLRADFSTVSLPGILSNTANKFLLAGFNAVEHSWRDIASTRPVKDFKTVTSYRLTGDMQYAEVGSDGELTHGTVGEESYTNRARTYGRLFAITRQDQINDDLGAFTDVPKRLGRGGALKLNLVFWTEFMDNTDFFKSANNNYQEGAATALGIDSLSTAEKLFFDQTDADGHPLGVAPAILLVPNALHVTATNIEKSLEMRDPSATKKSMTRNPHAGKFKSVRSSYLGNSQITGNSTLKWYLLADPQELPVIEVAFLNGRQEPTVESAQADFSTLGIQMRGYHDFGVSKQEYRAGVGMKGEA